MTRDVAGTLGEWSLARTAPNACATSRDLARAQVTWIGAPVPGTVAQALGAAGEWDFDQPRDFDADDWWYRCSFPHAGEAGCRDWLHFDGLATLTEVWLNNTLILTTGNMFQEHRLDVTPLLGPRNELAIGFRSLGAALTTRRPRPRWKTRLVSHQQWRWFRTTLLGRIPGWSPPVAPVGPWRAVSLERRRAGTITELDVHSSLVDGAGIVDVSCSVAHPAGAGVTGDCSVGDSSAALHVEREDGGSRLSARVRVANPALWWPHTHGRPSLHACALHVLIDGASSVHDCGAVGFRHVEARRDHDGFALDVNGTEIFCRGACWTPRDIVSLAGSAADLRRDLALMQQAGANMIRVGGTMVYEDEAFYRICDELGLLVWQDFMFANMDYPAGDASFAQSVEIEATQQLRRFRRHPCLAVYCGNSEVEQQAAMLGVEKDAWRSELFSRVLPDLCNTWDPDVPYVPSTPSGPGGGALPFHTRTGLTHYYGVGAYRRPLSDVRRANVRFSPECLGFANVPEPDLVDRVMHGDRAATHDARWKQRTPRDSGAGWDFEDVRDHYLGELFTLDPGALRSVDPVRYLELGRVTTGEVMARVFSEWRSAYSTCRGGLVWFLRDLWPGAGWGILDSRGVPKACFHFLRRAWQPQAVVITDEGLDGLHLHAINETDRAMSATLELTLLHAGHVVAARGATRCDLEPRSLITIGSDALLGGFHDVSYAYRFGPPTHDVAVATLRGDAGEVISEAFWIRDALAVTRHRSGKVTAQATALGGGSYALTLTSERFLFAARIDAPGYLADDNYFSLMPAQTKVVGLHAGPGAHEPFRGNVEALNLDVAVRIELRAPALVAS